VILQWHFSNFYCEIVIAILDEINGSSRQIAYLVTCDMSTDSTDVKAAKIKHKLTSNKQQ